MPSGKQNTFANRTLPDAVVVRVRDTQSISLVGAFEEPVTGDSTSGRLTRAAQKLAAYTQEVEERYDQQPTASWVLRVGPGTKDLAALGGDVSLSELIKGVGEEIAARLTENA